MIDIHLNEANVINFEPSEPSLDVYLAGNIHDVEIQWSTVKTGSFLNV